MHFVILAFLTFFLLLLAAWGAGRAVRVVIDMAEWRAANEEHEGSWRGVPDFQDSWFTLGAVSGPRAPLLFRLAAQHGHYIVSVLIFFALLPVSRAVGFSEDYSFSEMRASGGSILNFAFAFASTAGLKEAFGEGVGTNPKKNWDLMIKAMTAAGIDRSEIGWIFCYCHFSANPAVWKRIAAHLVATQKISQTSLVMFDKFVSICHWHQGAIMTETRIAPQKILGSNPSLAALTWLYVSPDRTYEDFIKRRWAIAMDTTPVVKAACLAEQEKFVKDVLKKSWSDKIPAIVGGAKFGFPDLPTGSKGTAALQNHLPGNKDEAAVKAWITHMTTTGSTGRI